MPEQHRAVFPGSFDPVTYGHVDVVHRAARLFDQVIVGVYDAPPKNLTFTTDERIDLFKEAIKEETNVEVRPYKGLTVEFAHQMNATVLVRGLRIGLDFEHEREMALVHRHLAPDIEVIMLIASLQHQFISSTRVKEIASLGADIELFVPAHVEKALLAKISQTGG